MSSNKSILVVDDNDYFRKRVVELISKMLPELVVYEAQDAESAQELLKKLSVQLLILDISLPGISGLELLEQIRIDDNFVKVLIVSMHNESLIERRVKALGGNGFIHKDNISDELILALKKNLYL